MSSYHSLLEPLFPGVNPAGIEAYIRLEKPAIDDLALDEFLHLAEKAVSYEVTVPGFLEDLIGRGVFAVDQPKRAYSVRSQKLAA